MLEYGCVHARTDMCGCVPAYMCIGKCMCVHMLLCTCVPMCVSCMQMCMFRMVLGNVFLKCCFESF